MKKSLCAVALSLLLALPAGIARSQEHEMEKAPGAEKDREPIGMLGGRMGRMMGPGHMRARMGFMSNNPKLAGIMMQMRGEMMRIRGEELSKMGDVLRRYGERIEKEGVK
jgi:hypothetical protein